MSVALKLYSASTLLWTVAMLAYSNVDTPASLLRSVLESHWRLVTVWNLGFMVVIATASAARRWFFGALSMAERALVGDNVLNFLMFKLVFVGAVLHVDLAEVLTWAAWFVPIGVLRVGALLTRQRIDDLCAADSALPRGAVARLLGANLLVLYLTVGLAALGFYLFGSAGTSVLLLLLFDCALLLLSVLRTTAAFLVHKYDESIEGVWERRSAILYNLDLCTDVLGYVLTLAHVGHLQYVHGLAFSLIDLTLVVQARIAWVKLAKRVAAHRNYVQLVRSIRETYRSLSGEQLVGRDDCCAICREKMLTALELPCSHLFHQSCLMTWLEEHSSCPNCRRHLLGVAADVEALRRARGQAPPPAQAQPNAPNAPAPHHHHHHHHHQHAEPVVDEPEDDEQEEELDDAQVEPAAEAPGAGLMGWLSSHLSPGAHEVSPADVQHVHDMFPYLEERAIARDLALTGSVELTVENVLEGRINLHFAAAPAQRPQRPAQRLQTMPVPVPVVLRRVRSRLSSTTAAPAEPSAPASSVASSSSLPPARPIAATAFEFVEHRRRPLPTAPSPIFNFSSTPAAQLRVSPPPKAFQVVSDASTASTSSAASLPVADESTHWSPFEDGRDDDDNNDEDDESKQKEE